jgi:hypothetical protein
MYSVTESASIRHAVAGELADQTWYCSSFNGDFLFSTAPKVGLAQA